jgi:hypothetical protein
MLLLPVIAIFASIVACILVFFVLLLALRTNSGLTAIQRQQAEEFAQLRRAIAKLEQPRVGTTHESQADGLPTIGASEPVLQVGDHVEVIDGLHEGEYGTIVPPPDWLPEGVVCVELAGGQGTRYLEVSKLARDRARFSGN